MNTKKPSQINLLNLKPGAKTQVKVGYQCLGGVFVPETSIQNNAVPSGIKRATTPGRSLKMAA